MTDTDKLVKSAMAAFVVLMTCQSAIAADDAKATQTEKCYGVARAGFNDCGTAKSSCSGSATKDNQGDAFLIMPKGLCTKLVGGSLIAKKPVSE